MPSDKPWSEGPWTVLPATTDADSHNIADGGDCYVCFNASLADARLIAAAPELVEALRDIRDGLEEYTTHGEPPDVDDLLEEFDANHGGLLARVEGGGEL